MNKLKKWAFGGAKDSDYRGDTSSYYGHEHDAGPGAEYTDAALPINKYQSKTLLHGRLDIEVRSARDLPNMDKWMTKFNNRNDVTDAYVDVRLGNARIAKTSVVMDNLNPQWMESYHLDVCHYANELAFEVRDKDATSAEFIGSVSFFTSDIANGEIKDGSFPIQRKDRTIKGELELRVQFISKWTLPKTYEVPCYFPVHNNCHVTLYQNAHCPPNLPYFSELNYPSGEQYVPHSCWTDVHMALMEAREIICITGWSLWTKLQLLRGRDAHKDGRTIGQLLVDKADQGVSVYILVWSDRTNFGATHDDETRNFFKGTRVHCAMVPRWIEKSELTDVLQNQFSGNTYSHHQKSIICDAHLPNSNRRRLVAFVGGLDLTDGRWDTPDHELFSTLMDEHAGDFYQKNAPKISAGEGPRQPWRDIHSKVEGPIAYDIFVNFYERWSQQGRKYGHLHQIDQSRIDVTAPALIPDPTRSWNVQFFRSITGDSAVLDPTRAHFMNSKKGRLVDSSISQAYVQQIRNADHFIYIENQYFLGSAYAWLQNNGVNCNHVIPFEITQKIVQKISRNERFCAYINIPMFPEGDPSSMPSQEILYWQTRTIEMMYKHVGDAIKQAGSESHPTDWLLFLCPGKREAVGPWLDRLDPPTEPNAIVMRRNLRGPIYVHSKMLIVDDAYIIVGSANINMRSMAGSRDTEMAVGCWQPYHPADNPYGDVHLFRMSLWAALLRHHDPVFRFPGTIECVHRVKTLIHHNWTQYVGPEGSVTPGILLPYPINVMPDGSLENLTGVTQFPDFKQGSRIIGKISGVIPEKLST